MCELFQLIEFTRSRDIWCDGVIELQVLEIDIHFFKLFGVGYFPDSLAPFELQMVLDQKAINECKTTILRFASADGDDGIAWSHEDLDPYIILQYCPQRNVDWAVAVEFTPK